MTQYSFAYDVVRENRLEDGSNELLELKLIECGPCLSGANPYTDTLSRKAVQEMLAAESGRSLGWAGTSIPKRAVDELRDKVSGVVEGFLDSVFDAAQTKETTMTRSNSELDRLNREIDELAGTTPKSDADLIREVDELAKTATGVVTGATAAVLMTAANHLGEASVRAQGAGLPDAVATLQDAARDLRTLASGGAGDVAAIIAAVKPLVAELRGAGQTVAAGNLERTLVELAGGVGVEYVSNEDRIGGSVDVTDGVTDSRDRYEPKHRTDADLIAEIDRLAPEHDRKPGGRFSQIGRVSQWIEDTE